MKLNSVKVPMSSTRVSDYIFEGRGLNPNCVAILLHDFHNSHNGHDNGLNDSQDAIIQG